MEDLDITIQDTYFCKSISGEEDENGNFKFEVEASNENLDLQNQITLQSALKKSEEYFITNGVISDDHLHKTRNPDGSIETHKDKIIGEPVSVKFDPATKKTYVKGILYSGIEAAKPYIELLKNKSRLVKASVGGIMPKVRRNSDGSETITSFMWNDLALTCSPVNWTVGGAKFAKAMNVEEFCKSLNAGYGTDAGTMTGGRSLQNEDIESETVNIMDITDGDFSGNSAKDDVKKSDEAGIIKDCIIAIDDGELTTKEDIESFLIERGFTKYKAAETMQEILKQGGIKMAKGAFSNTIDEILKSIKPEKEEKNEKVEKELDFDSYDEEPETDGDSENDDEESEDDEDEKVEKNCGVKKGGEFFDATTLITSLGQRIDDLSADNDSLRKSIEELQTSLTDVTKSFADYAKIPVERNTVMQKSIDNASNAVENPGARPSTKDFDVLKSCLVKAARNGDISVNEVQYFNAEFQKSMKGEPMTKGAWGEICNIVKKYR